MHKKLIIYYCIFSFDLFFGQTFLLDNFTGVQTHASLLEEKVKAALVNHPKFELLERSFLDISTREVLLSSNGIAEEDSAQFNYMIGKFLLTCNVLIAGNKYMAAFNVVDLYSSAVTFSKGIHYAALSEQGKVSEDLMQELNKVFHVKLAPDSADVAAQKRVKKIEEKQQQLKREELLYMETEKVWNHMGATKYESEVWKKSLFSMEKWEWRMVQGSQNPSRRL